MKGEKLEIVVPKKAVEGFFRTFKNLKQQIEKGVPNVKEVAITVPSNDAKSIVIGYALMGVLEKHPLGIKVTISTPSTPEEVKKLTPQLKQALIKPQYFKKDKFGNEIPKPLIIKDALQSLIERDWFYLIQKDKELYLSTLPESGSIIGIVDDRFEINDDHLVSPVLISKFLDIGKPLTSQLNAIFQMFNKLHLSTEYIKLGENHFGKTPTIHKGAYGGIPYVEIVTDDWQNSLKRKIFIPLMPGGNIKHPIPLSKAPKQIQDLLRATFSFSKSKTLDKALLDYLDEFHVKRAIFESPHQWYALKESAVKLNLPKMDVEGTIYLAFNIKKTTLSVAMELEIYDKDSWAVETYHLLLGEWPVRLVNASRAQVSWGQSEFNISFQVGDRVITVKQVSIGVLKLIPEWKKAFTLSIVG